MAARKATKDEQLVAWERLAYEINLHRTITMQHDAVISCLKRIDGWVAAHGDANGERSQTEVNANVNEAFWKYIAAKQPPVKVMKQRKESNVEE